MRSLSSRSLRYLHSNMFLLIRGTDGRLPTRRFYLHSNMFLLILKNPDDFCQFPCNLHSNMFLLIPGCVPMHSMPCAFTFQYVSINTRSRPDSISGEINLHSNMFLLILKQSWEFVFHLAHLHSNMFLLIQGTGNGIAKSIM